MAVIVHQIMPTDAMVQLTCNEWMLGFSWALGDVVRRASPEYLYSDLIYPTKTLLYPIASQEGKE